MSSQLEENNDDGGEPWGEYRLLVVSELKRLSRKIDTLEAEVIKLRLKAAYWGGAAGLIAYAIGQSINLFTGHRP